MVSYLAKIDQIHLCINSGSFQFLVPEVVADQLSVGIELFAHALEGLDAEQWLRPLVYGFPDPTVRTVEWMAHHTLHEVVHHLADMERLVSA